MILLDSSVMAVCDTGIQGTRSESVALNGRAMSGKEKDKLIVNVT